MSGVVEFKVGDRVQSVYGLEHVGTVVEASRFDDGRPYWMVRRDLDGFCWVGLTLTMVPAATMN